MQMQQTHEGRQFAESMAWSVGWVELRISGRTACNCGCNRPDRVEFTVGDRTIAILSPDVVDRVIKTLQELRRKLWAEP